MTVTDAPSRHMTALAAWSAVQAARAQLRADVAAGADVQLLAADKASIVGLSHRVAHSARRIDVLV